MEIQHQVRHDPFYIAIDGICHPFSFVAILLTRKASVQILGSIEIATLELRSQAVCWRQDIHLPFLDCHILQHDSCVPSSPFIPMDTGNNIDYRTFLFTFYVDYFAFPHVSPIDEIAFLPGIVLFLKEVILCNIREKGCIGIQVATVLLHPIAIPFHLYATDLHFFPDFTLL